MKTRKNVRIKPVSLNDINNIMSWINDPDVIKNFQHFGKKFTKQEELKFLKKVLANNTDYIFSIFKKGTNEYIGQSAINQINWQNKLGRLSLLIKKEHWGKGYAQEVIPLLLEYAFKKLKLNKVWLMAYQSNKKGMHIYKKMGFKKEGVLQEEYFWNGTYHTIIRMAMLASSYKKLTK